MKIYDYHVHSEFSEDCDVDMEKMIKAAIKQGVTELCFTDHMEFDYPDENLSFIMDYDAYMKKFLELQDKYKNKISIKSGVEIGMQKHIISDCDEFVKGKNFDFVIASQHCVDNLDLYYKEYFIGKTTKEIFKGYYEELYENIEKYKDWDVLGHLDLVRRYSADLLNYDVNKTLDDVEELLKKVIDMGKGIEVNAGGHFYKTGINPSTEILKLYKDLGGEIITYGSDSHKEDRIAAYHNHTMEILKELNYKYICSYEERKPIFHKID